MLPKEHPKSTKKSKEESVKVNPPKGYHWMQTREGPVLMEGDYEPHDGAVEAFPFTVLETHEDERIIKAEYQGRKVELNKPRRLSGENKKFGVYVKNDKGNVVQVKFGDPNLDIKRDDPERRRNFRARHNCKSPGPKHKARYWSCKMWSAKNVSDILAKSNEHIDDILHIIQKQPKKRPPKGRGARQPPGTWMANCKLAARKLSGFTGDKFTGPRNVIRDESAWCAELYRNPGKFSKPYKKPDGGGGMTSGFKLRDAVGRANFKP